MAVRFDGTSGQLNYTGTLPDPTVASTVTGWAFLSVDRDAFTTFWRMHLAAGGGRGQLGTLSNGTGLVHWASEAIEAGYDVVAGAWTRLAVVTSGATRTVYWAPDVEGATSSAGGSSAGMSAPDAITLGGVAPGNDTEPLNGRLAHVRVFSTALSQAEVEAEWASATPVLTAWADWPLAGDIQDASGNGRHLTQGSGTPVFEPGPALGPPDEPPRVTVSTTPVLLTPGAVGSPGRRVSIRNANTAAGDTLSLGGTSSVTAGDGFLLAGGAQLTLPLTPGDEIWAVRGGATDVAVHVLRLGPQ